LLVLIENNCFAKSDWKEEKILGRRRGEEKGKKKRKRENFSYSNLVSSTSIKPNQYNVLKEG